jgi:hypothetical protein
MTTPTLAQRIEQQYKNELLHPFPLTDVRKLKSIDPDKWRVLHGELDVYFAYIAGYASSATRLTRRPRAELLEATVTLSQSFFEKHKSLAVYRDAITEASTPILFREMAATEKLRKELLMIMEEILADPSR